MTVLMCGDNVQGLSFHEKELTPRYYQYIFMVGKNDSDVFLYSESERLPNIPSER